MLYKKNALIIFIKNPQLGKVKTRVAQTVGDEKALEIYLKLLKITHQNTKILRGVKCHLYYSDFINNSDEWSEKNYEKHVQNGTDLGARMAEAFSEILKHHEKVCIMGSDCPTLSPDILQKAFQDLETTDFVLGPSTDGGYYLLGMNRGIDFKIIFSNMVWSTDSVLSETLKRIATMRKSVALLPELTDVDEAKDWFAFLAQTSH